MEAKIFKALPSITCAHNIVVKFICRNLFELLRYYAIFVRSAITEMERLYTRWLTNLYEPPRYMRRQWWRGKLHVYKMKCRAKRTRRDGDQVAERKTLTHRCLLMIAVKNYRSSVRPIVSTVLLRLNLYRYFGSEQTLLLWACPMDDNETAWKQDRCIRIL